MTITIKCDKCGEGKEYSSYQEENEFRQQYINELPYFLCTKCLKDHDQLSKGINRKHQAEKQKSLELWLNNKYD